MEREGQFSVSTDLRPAAAEPAQDGPQAIEGRPGSASGSRLHEIEVLGVSRAGGEDALVERCPPGSEVLTRTYRRRRRTWRASGRRSCSTSSSSAHGAWSAARPGSPRPAALSARSTVMTIRQRIRDAGRPGPAPRHPALPGGPRSTGERGRSVGHAKPLDQVAEGAISPPVLSPNGPENGSGGAPGEVTQHGEDIPPTRPHGRSSGRDQGGELRRRDAVPADGA